MIPGKQYMKLRQRGSEDMNIKIKISDTPVVEGNVKKGDVFIIDGEPYAIFQVECEVYKLLGIGGDFNRWRDTNYFGKKPSEILRDLENGEPNVRYIPNSNVDINIVG